MRYATFSLPTDPRPRVGAVRGTTIADVHALVGDAWPGPGSAPTTLLELIHAGPAVWKWLDGFLSSPLPAAHSADGSPLAAAVHDGTEVRWHAPIPRPTKNILCLGLNYFSHVVETAKPLDKAPKRPEVPIFFTKAPTTANGPFDAIAWDRAITEQLDYEAELGVIVGVGGKNLTRGRALEHVFGYTVINDVSARDVQFRHKQWFKGKSLDGFCPMGPVVVTADEFGDPQQKHITLRVNGEVRQDATTADMIFPVDVTLEYLSQGMTLEPGDIIATGTPDGVGLGRVPPLYLQHGDVIETEVEGIGTLRNRVAQV